MRATYTPTHVFIDPSFPQLLVYLDLMFASLTVGMSYISLTTNEVSIFSYTYWPCWVFFKVKMLFPVSCPFFYLGSPSSRSHGTLTLAADRCKMLPHPITSETVAHTLLENHRHIWILRLWESHSKETCSICLTYTSPRYLSRETFCAQRLLGVGKIIWGKHFT